MKIPTAFCASTSPEDSIPRPSARRSSVQWRDNSTNAPERPCNTRPQPKGLSNVLPRSVELTGTELTFAGIAPMNAFGKRERFPQLQKRMSFGPSLGGVGQGKAKNNNVLRRKYGPRRCPQVRRMVLDTLNRLPTNRESAKGLVVYWARYVSRSTS